MKLTSAAAVCAALLCLTTTTTATPPTAASPSPALPGTVPSIGPESSHPAQQAENVILFTLDGLRWQEVFGGADEALLTEDAGGVEDLEATRAEFWRPTPEESRRAIMPFLWDVIAPSGQIFGNAWRGSEMLVTNGRNFSYPCYHEMLGGFPDERIDSNAKQLNPNPNVLEWIAAQPGFKGRVAAFTAWDVFPYILNEPRAGIPVNAGWELLDDTPLTPRQDLLNDLMRTSLRESEGVRSDELTFFAALEYLEKEKPRVLFVSLDGTDAGSHARDYHDYLSYARMGDEYARMLWRKAESLEQYAGKTTLIFTVDHGRGDPPDEWRGHGADYEGSEKIWLAAMGPGTAALGERTSVATLTESQIAATIAALLGLDYGAAVPQAASPIEALLR
jgi:hypothetical protein